MAQKNGFTNPMLIQKRINTAEMSNKSRENKRFIKESY